MDTNEIKNRLFAVLSGCKSGPMRKRGLAKALDIEANEYRQFRKLLEEMADRGEIVEMRKGKYGLPGTAAATGEAQRTGRRTARAARQPKAGGAAQPEAAHPGTRSGGGQAAGNTRTGRIEIKRGGMGFLISDPPGQDLYISQQDLGGALDGDIVAVEMKRRTFQGKRRGRGPVFSRPGGRVVKIIERRHARIVGTFYARRPSWPHEIAGRIVPDTRGLFAELDVLAEHKGAAADHDKVVVELIEAADAHRSGAAPTARVVHVFGKAGEADADIQAILQNNGIRTEFPAEVLRQADAIPETIPDEELRQRTDYTQPVTFTIDPEDARDHDDAVALVRERDGRTTLLVHIADVSYYVPEESAIDLEARERATSVYLPGQVFPMLPPKLSNHLCSLKEGQLRLTKTARIVFGPNLTPLEVRIERSFIRSAAFLTYDQVKEALDEDKPELVRSPEIFETLKAMRAFAAALRQKRLSTGSLNLDIPEAKLLLDEKMEVRGWVTEVHHWAHELIEDMMLAGNRAVAEYLVEHEIPGLFRVHEEPDPAALKRFAEFIREFGISLRPPFDRLKLKAVLDRVHGKDCEHAVSLALLTSLKQARYAAECRPHFALNFARYLHFTSPIRRYPDLIVHRALDARFQPGQAALPLHGKKRAGGPEGERYFERVAWLRTLATHCSERERAAGGAEEEVIKFRQLQFLRRNMKPAHPGLITGVREWGLFVELQDCHVEGTVPVENLYGDSYEYFDNQHMLRGRRMRQTYRLGDRVEVRIVSIDLGKKAVFLEMV
jgi:ribonuclease R